MISNSTYFVPDVIGSSCERLFILESPYKDELITKVPASGETGRVMTRYLYREEIPLGKGISEGRFQMEGILNAIQFPLDVRAYPEVPIELKPYTSIKQIAYDSTTYKALIRSRMNEIDVLHAMENFKKRLEIICLEKDVKELIVCGLISQALFEGIYPVIGNPKFKTWCSFRISNKDLKLRYTHHPSPATGHQNWSI